MPISDIFFVLRWWSVLFLLGVLILPITSSLFAGFYDKGYALAKILGLALVTYLIFLFGISHVLPFTPLFSYVIICIVAGINLIYLRHKKTSLGMLLKPLWRIAIFEEVLFLASLFYWSFIRAHQPDIHGLEKYMDYGFINSILRSTYFPPHDMWLTPLYINYYYFGHLSTAVLTRLTAIPSYITFNLMLATIFAACITGSFSIGSNLLWILHSQKREKKLGIRTWVQIIVGGVFSAFLVSFGGNLHTIYTFFKAYPNDTPVPPWQLPFMPESFPNAYWYPNATRFIYHTIHEFPIYSFVVSDLHGHVLDIPYVLLTIAVFLSLLVKYSSYNKTREDIRSERRKPNSIGFNQFISKFDMRISDLLIISFLLSVMYMTNAWDGLIYLIFALLCIAYLALQLGKRSTHTWLEIFGNIFKHIAIVFMGFVLFCLPFSLFFKPFASQIGIVCPPAFLVKLGKIGPLIFEADHCQRSPLWQLMILWGFFYFWIITLLVFLIIRRRKRKEIALPDIFMLLMAFCGTMLIIAPEFIYLRDIYTTYFRANTMFKMVYQAFMMLALVSGYTILRLLSSTSLKTKLLMLPYLIVGCVLIGIVGIYPYFAIGSYYNNVKIYQGLNGITYLGKAEPIGYPNDYAAIQWLNEHINGQPVILEAQGDSYTDYARVSANTGLPTVLGWTVHEWLWRNTYAVVPQRVSDIQTLYETADSEIAKGIISKYHISLVFIGTLERKKYKVREEKFKELGKEIYTKGDTTIYQISTSQ